jgi:hypothetical protein
VDSAFGWFPFETNSHVQTDIWNGAFVHVALATLELGGVVAPFASFCFVLVLFGGRSMLNQTFWAVSSDPTCLW